jgi:hypothetical protein
MPNALILNINIRLFFGSVALNSRLMRCNVSKTS